MNIASLLSTDTGDAGTSPHVARRFFFNVISMTNIAIYIITHHIDKLVKFYKTFTKSVFQEAQMSLMQNSSRKTAC